MNKSILVGLGAGLASSILFASALTGTLLGVLVLFLLSPMPVAIAGLGWGWASGALAAFVASLLTVFISGPKSGAVYVLAIGLPTAAFAYFALLNRIGDAGDDGSAPRIEWYPLGRLLTWASFWAGVLAAFWIWGMGGDFAQIHAGVAQSFEKVLANMTSPGGKQLTAEERGAIITVTALLAPWAIASLWMAVSVLNWWIAARITRQSGRLVRPWEDLSSVELPPQVSLGFGASLLGMMFLGGTPMMVATGFAGGFTFALMLAGLGLIHRITRGSTFRTFLLSLLYAALLFGSFLMLLVAFLGLVEPFFRRRLPPPPPVPPPAAPPSSPKPPSPWG
jgi:Predicted membrane protein (DUF2232)